MIAFGAALAAGATTAAAAGPVPTLASPISEPILVGTDGDGQSQALTVGQELAVALPDNPSTGYQWQLREVDQNVLAQEGDPQFRPGANPMPGSPGTVVWTFTAASPGTTKLTLVSVRPWEQGAAPAQQFSLNVTVR
ncbi:protease inhibitor I42 family protein [Nocardia sp. NPDC003482]